MRKTATNTILFLSAIILFTSGTATAQAKKLADTQWKLVEARGQAVTRSMAGVNFDAGLTKFTGNTGCNQMFGELTVRGSNIDFRNIGMTKRMCKLMPGNVVEDVYIKALEDATKFQLRRDQIILTDRRGRTVLRFTKLKGSEPDADISLGDRKWVLESIKGRQTYVPIKGAFLNFDQAKGSAGGDTSCNVFGGSYSATAGNIKFTDIMSTMRACVEDAAKMSVERDMLDGLRKANQYEIRDTRLFLYRGQNLLLTFRAERK